MVVKAVEGLRKKAEGPAERYSDGWEAGVSGRMAIRGTLSDKYDNTQRARGQEVGLHCQCGVKSVVWCDVMAELNKTVLITTSD